MSLAVENQLEDMVCEDVPRGIDLHQYTYFPDSAIFAISGKAFDLIDKYAMPPDPISYAVWFSYASKVNSYLCKKLDDKLNRRGIISRQEIALIYRNYLEDSYVADAQQNLGLELETNLNGINATMANCSEVYNEYSRALDEAMSRIKVAESEESLSAIADYMLTQSERVSAVTERLENDLNESRAHIEYLNRQLEDLQNLSLKDSLTNTSNRRAFDTHLKKQIEIAELNNSSLCLAFADLDHFKRVNDELGHQIGDVVLKHFARLLMKLTPEGAVVARYGGEEFALILPELTKVDAHNLANKLCYKFREERFLTDNQHKILGPLTASFGLSFYEPGHGSYELLEAADKKLYEAKDAGRNCVRTQGLN